MYAEFMMEVGSKNLAMVHRLSGLSIEEERCERERSRSFICKVMGMDKELICPKARREESQGMVEAPRSTWKLWGHASGEGEAGHEILDILFNKANTGDVASSGSPVSYFFGSPPNRAGNPLIHDVNFTQERAVSLSLKSPRDLMCSPSTIKSNYMAKSVCGTLRYGAKPFVRIEGFVSSTLDSHHGVQSCA